MIPVTPRSSAKTVPSCGDRECVRIGEPRADEAEPLAASRVAGDAMRVRGDDVDGAVARDVDSARMAERCERRDRVAGDPHDAVAVRVGDEQ